jgi:hypothetical protein
VEGISQFAGVTLVPLKVRGWHAGTPCPDPCGRVKGPGVPCRDPCRDPCEGRESSTSHDHPRHHTDLTPKSGYSTGQAAVRLVPLKVRGCHAGTHARTHVGALKGRGCHARTHGRDQCEAVYHMIILHI